MVQTKENNSTKIGFSLKDLVFTCQKLGYAMALWRLPFGHEYYFLADFSGNPQIKEIDFDDQASGFCLGSFLSKNGEALWLKSDFYCKFDANFNVVEQSTPPFEIQHEPVDTNNFFLEESINNVDKYKNLVNFAINNIKERHFDKIVISRQKKLKFKGSFKIIDSFKKLVQKYESAFVSMVFLPQTNEIWMGASPETLVSISSKGIFKTMSLAGTQAATDTNGHIVSLGTARWSQKEIEEQAYVSRYIIDCLKKVRVREYTEIGPKTVQAGNLLHLQSIFTVNLNEINFDHFGNVMLKLLHPTSAVCGMPLESTKKFIIANEGYDRSFYSGFLGPVNIEESSELFVNLRSVKICNGLLTAFAGAGITADSIPEKEWNETEMKMETLLSVLHD